MDGRKLCEMCMQAFAGHELAEHQGRWYCPACLQAFTAATGSKKQAGDIGANPAGAGPWARLHSLAAASAAGKLWYVRAPLLLYFGYALVMYWADAGNYRYPGRYTDWFKALNLGIHEAGHYLFAPLGEWMSILGGSLLQCLVPVAAMVMFCRRRELFSIAACCGWLSLNLFDVAVYQADSLVRKLHLVTPGGGHARHDWVYLLHSVGLLEHAHGVAFLTRVAATLAMAVCLAGGAWMLWLMHRERRQ